jgi:hypothetical protein
MAELLDLDVDTHLFSISTLILIFYDSVDSGKEGVVLPHPHILSGMNSSPLLTNQDISSLDPLPTESFDAQTLSSAIPAVTRTSSCLLMCHAFLLKSKNSDNQIHFNFGFQIFQSLPAVGRAGSCDLASVISFSAWNLGITTFSKAVVLIH